MGPKLIKLMKYLDSGHPIGCVAAHKLLFIMSFSDGFQTLHDRDRKDFIRSMR